MKRHKSCLLIIFLSLTISPLFSQVVDLNFSYYEKGFYRTNIGFGDIGYNTPFGLSVHLRIAERNDFQHIAIGEWYPTYLEEFGGWSFLTPELKWHFLKIDFLPYAQLYLNAYSNFHWYHRSYGYWDEFTLKSRFFDYGLGLEQFLGKTLGIKLFAKMGMSHYSLVEISSPNPWGYRPRPGNMQYFDFNFGISFSLDKKYHKCKTPIRPVGNYLTSEIYLGYKIFKASQSKNIEELDRMMNCDNRLTKSQKSRIPKSFPYKEKFEEILKKAEAGDRDAQYKLAHWIFKQYGNNLSNKDGYFWLMEAAKAGHSIAQYENGMYLGKQDTKTSETESMLWLRKSADQGYSPAIDRISFLESPLMLAKKWFKKRTLSDIAAKNMKKIADRFENSPAELHLNKLIENNDLELLKYVDKYAAQYNIGMASSSIQRKFENYYSICLKEESNEHKALQGQMLVLASKTNISKSNSISLSGSGGTLRQRMEYRGESIGFNDPPPTGHGSIWRFDADTDNLVGFDFYSDENNRLHFIFIEGEGLVCMFGRGFVVTPQGAIIYFGKKNQ